MRSRFSSPVSSLSTAEYWPVTPIAPRTSSGLPSRSCPATWTVPPSAGIRVDRIWTVVVLPAPFGPSREKIVPSGTARSTPSSTTLSPYDLCSPFAAMAKFVMMVLLRGCGSETAGDDVAVAGGRADVELGGGAFGVLERVVDPAEGGAGVQGCRYSGGGVDRHVAGLGAQHDRAADRLVDADVALAGADLGGAVEAADRDVAGHGGEANARGLVDLDRAVRALEGDVAEPSDGAEIRAGHLGLDPGTGGPPGPPPPGVRGGRGAG